MTFQRTDKVTVEDAVELFEKEVESIDRKIESFECVIDCRAYGLRRLKNIYVIAISALREQEERCKVVLTNADHIRAMSDEELADMLVSVYIQDYWEHPDEIQDWIKQPHKEDA